MPVSLKCSPLNIVVSKTVASLSDISAVNLIVGWNLFAFSMNCRTSSFEVTQRDTILSVYSISILAVCVCFVVIFEFLFAP